MAGFWAGGPSRRIEIEAVSEGAHPAGLTGGVPHHQSKCGDVFGHHSTRSYEGISSDVMATYDGRIGPYAGAFPHMGFGVLSPPHHGTARVGDVGKHARGAEEDIIGTGHTCVEAHVVLNLAVAAQHHIGADDHILSDVAAFTQHCTRHDVAKMPHFTACTNGASFIDDRSGVGKP